MQKDKYNNNKKKQKVERQKNSKKLDNKSEKKISLYCKFSFFLNFKQFYILFQILPSQQLIDWKDCPSLTLWH